MRHLLLATVVAAAGLFLPGHAADIQEWSYLNAVDRTGKEVVIVRVGQDSILSRIWLTDQPYSPYGVTFGSSWESNCGGISFATQGPLLRVLDHTMPVPRATLNVEQQYPEYGLTSLYLRRLAAERFSASDGTEIDLIWVVGERSVDAHYPWLLVFDETALLAEPLAADSALVAAAPLCTGCAGVALDVAVRAPVAYSGEQEAFVSVLLQSEPELYQRFFHAVLHEPDQDHDDYWLEVSHHPTIEDNVVFDGTSPFAFGVDYGTYEGDQVPFSVLKSTAAVIDLSTGVPSCPLSGSPADVVVSSPAELENRSYHFVITDDNGDGYLLGFPVGSDCPDGGADSIQVPIVTFPQASVLVSESSDTPWIYVVGAGTGISGVHLELAYDEQTGDQITLLESFVIEESGYYTSVAATRTCPDKTTPWDDICDDPEYQDDPHCDDDDDPIPQGGGKSQPVQIEPN